MCRPEQRRAGVAENRLTHVVLAREQSLIVEGEPNDSLYIITEGCLRLTKLLADGRRQITGFLFPGDFVGLMPTKHLPFSAEALSASRACRFSHSGLAQLSEEHPGIKDRLIQSADTELVKAQDHMMLLGQKTAMERVASFFTMLSRRTPLGAVISPYRCRVRTSRIIWPFAWRRSAGR
ncbi:cyclic nucleotide-binding domain-containing protein [Hankyongella ginsenosidimutans]|uniref:Cyclic nucleotide-binding domain-containing protein n=1 Tax=Hankyongella ginsenosidimutans TaxID=1763828 RepID=A0A4D7C3B9_9SPHN|nr:cyclic nucleotide-binding domain-containing protein [Hankyongella ginsenosidimutans]